MDEQNVKNEKKKELLNIYWFLLMVMAAVSLVNLLAISTDSMNTKRCLKARRIWIFWIISRETDLP